MWFLDMVQKYILIEPKFYGVDDQILGLFGGRTSSQERRENEENAARDETVRRRNAMENWRRKGRPGSPVAPEWLTDEDRKEIQRNKDFEENVQSLRDKPVLGSTSFTSILSPKRNTQGIQKSAQGGTSPGGPPRSTIGDPGGTQKPTPGGAFGGGSALASRKRKRTILG